MNKNILLIGDSCNDYYHFGNVARLSPEAPIPILDVEVTKTRSGMAANVYQNFVQLGIFPEFYSHYGETKHRYIDKKSGQQLLRVDDRHTIATHQFKPLTDYSQFDAIVISDYDKGFVTYEAVEAIHKNYAGPIFIDTKKNDLARFNGCILKINQHEWDSRISENTNVIVTRGADPILYRDKLYYPPKRNVHDVCGAGDTFLAALVYSYLANNDLDSAIKFAIRAATVTVNHIGVYAPSIEEILEIDEL